MSERGNIAAGFRAELLALFVAESRTRLDAIQGVLARIERLPDGELEPALRDLHREAHSLRGGAAIVKLPAVEQTAKGLEQLTRFLHDRRRVDSSTLRAARACLNELANLLPEIDE